MKNERNRSVGDIRQTIINNNSLFSRVIRQKTKHILRSTYVTHNYYYCACATSGSFSVMVIHGTRCLKYSEIANYNDKKIYKFLYLNHLNIHREIHIYIYNNFF